MTGGPTWSRRSKPFVKRGRNLVPPFGSARERGSRTGDGLAFPPERALNAGPVAPCVGEPTNLRGERGALSREGEEFPSSPQSDRLAQRGQGRAVDVQLEGLVPAFFGLFPIVI